MVRWLVVLLLLVVAASSAQARDSKSLQKRYCAGMKTEQHLRSGGRVDCVSATHAIEVEWAKDWYQAVGQSLYYAAETGKRPGIIILCPGSDQYNEGLCRSYLYRLGYAFQFVRVTVDVWECFPEDATLNDCFRPDVKH